MDGPHFDSLACRLSGRRAIGSLLVGGLAALLRRPALATAHNRTARCRRLTVPAQRRACLRRARQHNCTHRCKPLAAEVVCRGVCGTAFNNCGQRIVCPCPPDKECLVNGSCAQVCGGPSGVNCPVGSGCVCFLSHPAGPERCVPDGLTCAEFPKVCASTADCPVNYTCIETGCGGVVPGRCAPLCVI
jgi:hypothetical protein